ncbi:MAG: hypothetical protein LBU34_05075 [Planctomycetaceae bacterium]|jgi:hypothetical protein|nr:hypothetical protein [Planctomycetaceae bacterium]
MNRDINVESITVPNQDKFILLIQLLKHPFQLFWEGSKLGFNSVGRLIGIIFLFSLVNIMLFGYAAYKLLWQSYSFYNIGILVWLIILGLLFTAYAGYRAYSGVVLDLAKFIYQNASPLFHTICERIIDHASEFYDKHSGIVQNNIVKIDPDGKKIEKIINIQQIITEQYGKVPKNIRNSVSFVLKQLPIVNMLFDLKDVLMLEGKEKATDLLHQKIDRYVEDSIFSRNTTFWILWLLPLNIIVLLFTIIVWK